MPHVIDRLVEGGVVIVPGDRDDVLLGVLLAHQSRTLPNLSGVVLNGGFALSPQVDRLVRGLGIRLPDRRHRGRHDGDRVGAVRRRGAASPPASARKIRAAVALVEDAGDLGAVLGEGTPDAGGRRHPPDVRARRRRAGARGRGARRAPRGCRGAHPARGRPGARSRASPGSPCSATRRSVRGAARQLGVDISAAEVVDPATSPLREQFARSTPRLRAHKGMTPEQAHDRVVDPSYFGTMMVHAGLADGMVSGCVDDDGAHDPSGARGRPHRSRGLRRLQRVPHVPGRPGARLRRLRGQPRPDGRAARRHRDLVGPHGRPVRHRPRGSRCCRTPRGSPAPAPTSTRCARPPRSSASERPTCSSRARSSTTPPSTPTWPAPSCQTARSRAERRCSSSRTSTPGNNTYKAVQRSADAVAIGPVLQGLNRPVNDLSRGALVRDIVNTVAITAVQAGSR